uniref:Uncharacterized protein n=1 Tax=Arundo donax TaxID=35708 RepID=A0A0A8Z6V1_ARUDO
MIPKGWHNYCLPALLLEKNKNEPVDTNIGLWALIAYDLSPKGSICCPRYISHDPVKVLS